MHFGSLVAALGSYLRARSFDGTWLIRMEDLDPPREVPGSAETILEQLAAFSLVSDEGVLYQSRRHDAYQQAIEKLISDNKAFLCSCSRKQLPANGIYPGTCRQGAAPGAVSVRFMVEPGKRCFLDRHMGEFCQDLGAEIGDFIIRRGDGLYAYQLAVVVDDAWQGITEVVRGVDLLDSTPRQIALFQALGFKEPGFFHLPLALDQKGRKISKRLGGLPVATEKPQAVLLQAGRFLGLDLPDHLVSVSLSTCLDYLQKSWQEGTPSIENRIV